MKSKIFFFLVILLAFSLSAQATDWTYSGLNSEFWVSALLQASDGTIYAGSDSGTVYKSTDGGDTWTATGTLTDAETIRDIIEAPDGTIYAASSVFLEPIYKTVDGGDNWTRLPDYGHDGGAASLLWDSNGVLYAGNTNYGAVQRSYDGGTTWEDTGALTGDRVSNLIEGSDGAIYALTGDIAIVYKSTDGGDNWTQAGSLAFAFNYWLAAMTEYNATILVGVDYNDTDGKAFGNSIYGSQDWGSTWTQVGYYDGWQEFGQFMLHADGSVYAGVGINQTGIIHSEDGQTWSDVDAVTAATGTVLDLIQTSDGYVIAATEPNQGVYKACLGCDIGDVCYMKEALNPANDCEVCDPDISTTAWQPANDGTTCDDGLFCNGADTCLSGSCDDHAGDPCLATEVCNEDNDTCDPLGDDDDDDAADDDDDDAIDDDDDAAIDDDDDDDIIGPGSSDDGDDDGCCGG